MQFQDKHALSVVENYFSYFTEIEEHYLRRRGTHLLLSTLDWALIETWKNAGVPLEAVLRGVDDAFDKYDLRPSKSKKVNSLAYCSQAVLAAAEDMKEAAVGATGEEKAPREPGFDAAQIAAFLRANAEKLEKAKLPERAGFATGALAREQAGSLREMAESIERHNIDRNNIERDNNDNAKLPRLEDLERRLTVLEEKLFAVLMAATPDDDLVQVRAEADRDIAPYRRNMTAAQVEQLHKQYIHKRLLERCGVPRLSLFYMH
ncbi:MAG: hypothetical protein ACLPLR_15755 [Terriglobales bacterium]